MRSGAGRRQDEQAYQYIFARMFQLLWNSILSLKKRSEHLHVARGSGDTMGILEIEIINDW